MRASIVLLPAASLLSLASHASPDLPPPSPCFSTALGGWGPEVVGVDVLPMEDGTFAVSAIVMTQYSFGDPWLFLLDSAGGFLWREAAGEAGLPVSRDLESGGMLEPAGDGSLLLAAFGQPRATGIDADAAVLRISPGEGLERATVIGGDDAGVYTIHGMLAGDDGAFVLAVDGGDDHRSSVRSFDSDGRLEWMVEDALGGGCTTACGVSDEGLVLLFQCDTACIERLIFIDGAGNVRTGPEVDPGAEVRVRTLLDDGGRILLGGSQSLSPWAGCLDRSGALLWQRTLEGFEGPVTDMAVSPDGSVTLCGFTSDCDGPPLAGLCRLDAGGGMEWSRRFGGGEYQQFESVSLLDDGGVILAGGMGVPMDDGILPCAWVLRTRDDGTVPGYVPELDCFVPETRFEPVVMNPMGFVVACGAFQDEADAGALSEELRSETGMDSGILWIPDWPSLSGTHAWLSYLGPVYPHDPRLVENRSAIAARSPDAYLVWVGGSSTRVTMTLDEAASQLP